MVLFVKKDWISNSCKNKLLYPFYFTSIRIFSIARCLYNNLNIFNFFKYKNYLSKCLNEFSRITRLLMTNLQVLPWRRQNLVPARTFCRAIPSNNNNENVIIHCDVKLRAFTVELARWRRNERKIFCMRERWNMTYFLNVFFYS